MPPAAPNWFIGFPVMAPPEWRALLAQVPERLRRFQPDDLHVTLAFLGPCGAAAADTAWRAALSIDWAPLRVQAQQARAFGHPRHPSAYGLVVDNDRNQLSALLAAHQGPLRERADLSPERRPPLPHVTLARPRRQRDSAGRASARQWLASLQLPTTPLILDRLALYTWAHDRRERLFRIVADQNAPARHN